MLYPSRKGKKDPKGNSEISRAATPTTGLELTLGGQGGEAVSSLVSKGGTTFSLSVEPGYPLPVPQGWGITKTSGGGAAI